MAFNSSSERRTRELRQGWFEIESLAAGVHAISEPFHAEQVRSHLVLGDERALLIDTGMGIGDLRAVVDELTSLPLRVINSHSHWDHIGSNWRFDEIAIHAAEADRLPLGVPNRRVGSALAPQELFAPLPTGIDPTTFSIPPSRACALLAGGERFDLGGRTIEIIHAPGHSPGGIVLLDRANGLLFSTDVAYAGPLYAFGSDADLTDYRRTLAALADLAPALKAVFPSHNAARIEPTMLPAMRDAIEGIVAGRPPEITRDGVATHRFVGFSVLIDAASAGQS